MATGTQSENCDSDKEIENSFPLYSDNLVDLLSLRKKQYYSALVVLISRTKETISWLEKQSPHHINTFSIGRTHVFRKRKKGEGKVECEKFNHVDPGTWDKQEIVSHWNTEYKPRNYSGLAALCVVTKDAVPRRAKKGRFCYDHQDYSFALEQALVQHFVFAEGDRRILNDLIPAGSRSQFHRGAAVGYMLYIAYMYHACEPETRELRCERAVGQLSDSSSFDAR